MSKKIVKLELLVEVDTNFPYLSVDEDGILGGYLHKPVIDEEPKPIWHPGTKEWRGSVDVDIKNQGTEIDLYGPRIMNMENQLFDVRELPDA